MKYTCNYKLAIPVEVAETPYFDAQIQGIEDFCIGKRDYTFFYPQGEINTLCVMIHGTETGLIAYKGYILTAAQLLHILLPKLKQKGITSVKTISCFGGLQQPAEEEGVTISSIHKEKTEIFCCPLMGGVDIHPANER